MITLEETDTEEDVVDPDVSADDTFQSDAAFIRRLNRFIMTLFIVYLLLILYLLFIQISREHFLFHERGRFFYPQL